MRGPRTGVTPGHDTGCEQDRIREREVQPCWSRDTQGLLANTRTGDLAASSGSTAWTGCLSPQTLLWGP